MDALFGIRFYIERVCFDEAFEFGTHLGQPVGSEEAGDDYTSIGAERFGKAEESLKICLCSDASPIRYARTFIDLPVVLCTDVMVGASRGRFKR